MKNLMFLKDISKSALKKGFTAEIINKKTEVRITYDDVILIIKRDIADLNKISIPYLFVPQENARQGHGSRLMNFLCEQCDKHSMKISLCASPFSWMNENDKEGLLFFYGKFGFTPLKDKPFGQDMFRDPESKPNLSKFSSNIFSIIEKNIEKKGVKKENIVDFLEKLGIDMYSVDDDLKLIFNDGYVSFKEKFEEENTPSEEFSLGI